MVLIEIMRFYLFLIFLFTLSLSVSGQVSRYVNPQYNFSITLPSGSEPLSVNSDGKASETAFICPNVRCEPAGIFLMIAAKPVPGLTVSQAVSFLQDRKVLANNTKELLNGFGAEHEATVLSMRYAAYNGRPANRAEFNFVKEGVSYNGLAVVVFVAEKRILVFMGGITSPSQSGEWNKIIENTVRSLSVGKAGK